MDYHRMKLYLYLAAVLIGLSLLGGLYFKGRSDGKAVVQAVLDKQRATWQAEYDKQVAETARVQAEWDRSKEREGEINARLQVVSLESADFSRRLRDYRARLRALSEAASTPAESDAASGIAGDLEQAEADHIAACSRDAERLTQYQQFYRSLQDAQ
jgi:predicted  nucleic acid-binding Zn-ribbon protein